MGDGEGWWQGLCWENGRLILECYTSYNGEKQWNEKLFTMEDSIMKFNTIKSANSLRVIARFIIVIGAIISILLVSLGIAAILSNAIFSYKNAMNFSNFGRSLFKGLGNLGGIGCAILGIWVFWMHFVAYVSVTAQATLIENSDRTDVVKALDKINETLAELKKTTKID